MPGIRQFESLIEMRLQGVASAEIASITAEFVVAVLFFLAIGAAVAMADWVVKKTNPVH